MTIQINARLPVGIEVLRQTEEGQYAIRLGQHTLQTKSTTPLEGGRTYWVDVKEGREGILRLAHLHPKPLLLTRPGHFFELQRLEALRQESDPQSAFRNELLQQMAQSVSKEQFSTLAFMLNAMTHHVVTLPFKKGENRALMQFKTKKSTGKLKQKRVEFYASMSHLGPLQGMIAQEDGLQLHLEVYYASALQLLKETQTSLEGFTGITLRQSSDPIGPIMDFSDTLLDLKG